MDQLPGHRESLSVRVLTLKVWLLEDVQAKEFPSVESVSHLWFRKPLHSSIALDRVSRHPGDLGECQ